MYLFKNSRFACLWTITTIGLSGLLIFNTLIYFQSEFTPQFLVEKGEIAQGRIWSAAFYVHIVSSCLILVCGCCLFFTTLLKHRRLHFLLGYLYINLVLWGAAPTGLIMSPYVKGGMPGAVGFAVTGFAWWWATWMGYREIRPGRENVRDKGRVNQHIAWMVRSWCLSLSAVTFRIIHIALAYAGLDPLTGYVASIWLSLIVNVWAAEVIVWRNLKLMERKKNSQELHVANSF